ncbi:hypothetical protein TIFTF001_042708 [Ficus carica]|uniref:Uncharacterized protein n=1 Tax=Ficus carica TaxID=3494 RepID=A0AA88DGA9_FICCA|nr:hypothetical protein TIFTF001_042708 [Ficus carica]
MVELAGATVKEGISRYVFPYALAVAILSPIGVLIGITIDSTTQGPMADWIFMISTGLACGVFIYVSISHLLAKGYTTKKTGHWKSTWTKCYL